MIDWICIILLVTSRIQRRFQVLHSQTKQAKLVWMSAFHMYERDWPVTITVVQRGPKIEIVALLEVFFIFSKRRAFQRSRCPLYDHEIENYDTQMSILATAAAAGMYRKQHGAAYCSQKNSYGATEARVSRILEPVLLLNVFCLVSVEVSNLSQSI
jgi:hypothetical protein